MEQKLVPTYKEFAEMTYEQPHRTLKKMLSEAQHLSISIDAVQRLKLLSALQAMRDKVAQPGRRGEPNPNKPSWEDECRMLGISPEVVRQWRRRTQVNDDIRHLLGEEPYRRENSVLRSVTPML